MRRGLRGRATGCLGSPSTHCEDGNLEVEVLFPVLVQGFRPVEGADVVLPDQGHRQVGYEDQDVVLLLLRRLRHRQGHDSFPQAGGVVI